MDEYRLSSRSCAEMYLCSTHRTGKEDCWVRANRLVTALLLHNRLELELRAGSKRWRWRAEIEADGWVQEKILRGLAGTPNGGSNRWQRSGIELSELTAACAAEIRTLENVKVEHFLEI